MRCSSKCFNEWPKEKLTEDWLRRCLITTFKIQGYKLNKTFVAAKSFYENIELVQHWTHIVAVILPVPSRSVLHCLKKTNYGIIYTCVYKQIKGWLATLESESFRHESCILEDSSPGIGRSDGRTWSELLPRQEAHFKQINYILS